VPLEYAKSIEVQEGSKYWLTLKDGERLPIGRTKVGKLRKRLSGMN
jgi:DNA-binding LytR/AlgR family response regulator